MSILRTIYLATDKDLTLYNKSKKVASSQNLSISKYILKLLEKDSLKGVLGINESHLDETLQTEECFITKKTYVLEVGDSNSKLHRKSFDGLLIACENTEDKAILTKTLVFQSSTNKIVVYRSERHTENNFKKKILTVYTHIDEIENLSDCLYQQIIDSIGYSEIEHLDI